MSKLKITIIILILSFTLFHCTTEEENPVPQALSVSPASIVAHLPEFTMTVNGQDFVESSVIVFDGKDKSTTFISPTQLSCTISPEDTMMDIVSNTANVDEIKNMEKPVSVAVRNPAPGGGSSSPVNFTLKENFEFETPLRIFNSISNGWAGPLIFDNDENLLLNITNAEVNKYNVKFSNYISISDNKGDTWSEPENYVRSSEQYNENLFVDDYGNTHFIYHNWAQSTSGIFYKRKNKDAQTWSEPVNIAGKDNSILQSYLEHKAAIRGDKIFVFWTVWTMNYDEFLVYTFSDDNGITWAEPVKLKDLGYVGWIESMISEDGTLHLVYARAQRKASWEFYVDIYTSRSVDNGITWSEPIMLSNGAGRSYYPQIVYKGSGNKFNIFWIYKQTGKVNLSMMANIDMRKREIIKRISEGLPPETINPDRPKTVIPPTFHLRMKHSEDGGNNWSGETNVLDFTADDYYFTMNFNIKTDKAGNLNLIVNEQGMSYGIAVSNTSIDSETTTTYFTRSIDGGFNWTAPVRFSTDPRLIAEFMTVDPEGNVYIILNKYNFNEYFQVEPFFSRSIK